MSKIRSKYMFPALVLFVISLLGFNEITNAKSSSIDYKLNQENKLCKQGIDTNGNNISVYIVRAISNKPVLPDTFPENLKIKGCELDITAAKGEYEAASFVVRSNINFHDELKITSTPLINAKDVIPESNVEIKLVKVWYQAEEAWVEISRNRSAKSAKEVLVPELLLNDEKLVRVDLNDKINYLRVNTKNGPKYIPKNSKEKLRKSVINLSPGYEVSDALSLQPISLKKNKNKQIWVTVFVPATVKAGEYTGNINIFSGNNELVVIPIKINVLTFELKESKLEYSMYYHGRIHESKKESISSEYKSPKQLRVELLDMLRHGIKNPIIYQHHIHNKSLLKEYLTIRENIGMDNAKLYFIWLNTNKVLNDIQIDNLRKEILKIKSFLKTFGTKEIYVYGRDEAKGSMLIEQQKAWDSIRELGVKVYVAGYKGTFEAIGKSLDLFVFAKAPMIEEAEKFHSINHRIFSYANPQSGIENPYIYRRNYGVVLWASGFDGAMIYAYQHSMGDAWNDSDHYLYRDHNFTYPTSNGVVRTIAWEGMREAIDDVKYLTKLENEIVNARIRGDVRSVKLVEKAENYMQSIKNEVVRHNRYGRYTNDFYIDLYKVRETIINYIIELTKFEKTIK